MLSYILLYREVHISVSGLALLYFDNAEYEEGNDSQDHQYHYDEYDLVLDNSSTDATDDAGAFAQLAICLSQLQSAQYNKRR